MKKLKLLTTALLASVLGLASCDQLNGIIDKFKGNEPEGETQNEDTTPAIKSVTITGAKAEIALRTTLQLNVTVVGTAAKGVSWTTSDSSVATVSSTGLVTPIAEGSVTITATSKYDNTKFDSVTMSVVDFGFDPSLIELGCTYSKTWPTSALEEFLGEGDYSLVELPDLVGGCYYMVYEADLENGYPAYVRLAIDGLRVDEYVMSLVGEGWTKVYETSYDGYEGVDPTGLYTVAIYSGYDEETYDNVAPTYFEFYLSSDVWADGTLTTDTAWSADHYDEYCEGYEAQTAALLDLVPFVQMGENYQISYNDMSLWRLFGYDIQDYITISDYTIGNSLDGYGDILTEAGFEYDEEEDVFVKEFGYKSMSIYTTFTEAGNTIVALPTLTELSEFPTEGVNDFISNNIGSIKELPEYTQTTESTYTFSVDTYEVDGGSTIEIASVKGSAVTFAEIEAYAATCETAGYVVDYAPATDDSYPTWEMQYYKICVMITFVQNYDEETETFSDTDGSLLMYIVGNESVHEIPGLYAEETVTGYVGSTIELDVEVVDLGDSPVLSFLSNDETVATVDQDGVVTCIAAGETTITVSCEYESVLYETEIAVTVKEKPLAEIVTFTSLFSDKSDGAKITSFTSSLGVTFECAKGSGQTDPCYYSADGLRFYKQNTLTITAPEGHSLTAVKFVLTSNNGGKTVCELSADSGSYDSDTLTWTGDAESVVFDMGTASKSQFRLTNIIVALDGTDLSEAGNLGGGDGLATCESVCTKLSSDIFGQSSNIFEEYETDYWYISVEMGTTSEYTLLSAVETICYLMPTDYTVINEPYEDTWYDSTDGVFAEYCVDNIEISIGSYEEDGNIIVQIDVYVVEQ